MKFSHDLAVAKLIFLSLILLFACEKDDNHPIPPEEPEGPQIFASGLEAPQGIEMDRQGRLWICEQGTGQDDGAIVMVDQDGIVHPFITGLASRVQEGMAGSAHHILIDGQTIWAALGVTSEERTSQLLRFEIGDFKAGDPSQVMRAEFVAADISDLVLNYPFQNQTGESNIYNLALGPNNKIYLVDAAANAILEFDKTTSQLQVLAELPTANNSTGQGPPRVDAVPTGIAYHQGETYVTAFSGFPFIQGSSKIFKINADGSSSTYYPGLNGAVDILSDGQDLFVLEYAIFQGGFQGNTSRLSRLSNGTLHTLADQLNFVSGVCQDSEGNFYVTSITTGEIIKISQT